MQVDRRQLLGAGLAAGLALAGPGRAAGAKLDYDRAMVIDGLGGLWDPWGDGKSLVLSARARTELKASGTTAIHVTVGEVGNERSTWDASIANIAATQALIDANPDLLCRAVRAADIRAAKASGRIALMMGTQDTAMIGTDFDRLDLLQGLGVRSVQLTYNRRNLSGDGALEADNAGLSKLGRETIAAIEARKLILDLSHGGARTIAEAIAAATRPMAISHTGCRSLHDNPRNVWDASMKACADKGGVVGIYWMPFLTADSHPRGADLVRHINHAVSVCGEDHVSIGTDGGIFKTEIDDAARQRQREFFERRQKQGIAAPGEGADVFNIVADFDDHRRFGLLANALAADGWPAARIEKLLGANLLRFWGDVWGG